MGSETLILKHTYYCIVEDIFCSSSGFLVSDDFIPDFILILPVKVRLQINSIVDFFE